MVERDNETIGVWVVELKREVIFALILDLKCRTQRNEPSTDKYPLEH